MSSLGCCIVKINPTSGMRSFSPIPENYAISFSPGDRSKASESRDARGGQEEGDEILGPEEDRARGEAAFPWRHNGGRGVPGRERREQGGVEQEPLGVGPRGRPERPRQLPRAFLGSHHDEQHLLKKEKPRREEKENLWEHLQRECFLLLWNCSGSTRVIKLAYW